MEEINQEQKNKINKLLTFDEDKDFAVFEEIQAANDNLSKIANNVESGGVLEALKAIEMVKGVPGSKGDKGDKGEKGDRGEQGKSGKDGKDGKDGKNGKDGKDGREGIDGLNGKDAEPLDKQEVIDEIQKELPQLGESIRDSLELLKGDERLSVEAISGLTKLLDKIDQKIKTTQRRVITKGFGGGIKAPAKITNITANYTIQSSFSGEIVIADATSGNLVVTLPTTTGTMSIYRVKKTDTSSNTVTITPNGNDTIDGGSSAILETPDESVTLITNGANWFVV